MPQARLPDINTRFIKFTNEAISSWKSENYDACLGSCYALNGLLAPEYRVTISTKDYEDKIKHDLLVVCNHCTAQSKHREANLFNRLCSSSLRYILDEKFEQVWTCPQCHHDNILLKTHMIDKIAKEPNYLKVVAKPPERKEGMMARTTFHKKFSQWFWNFMDELGAQMALFRDDNWQRSGEYTDEDVDTSGEDDK